MNAIKNNDCIMKIRFGARRVQLSLSRYGHTRGFIRHCLNNRPGISATGSRQLGTTSRNQKSGRRTEVKIPLHIVLSVPAWNATHPTLLFGRVAK